MSSLVLLTASYLLPALVGALMLLAAVAILPSPIELGIYAGLAAVFVAPGWPLARWVSGREADPITRTLVALPLGYLAGGMVTCLLRLAGVSRPAVVLASCAVLTVVLAWTFRRNQDGLMPFIRLGPADRVALALLSLVALAIVGPVFARVGEPTPDGLAYRAYFNADLFVHMGVVAELAKGSTPPLNPYLPSEPLPYYWTYFTLPALFSRLRPELLVDRGIMLTDMGMAAIFLNVAYLAVRNIGTSALATTVAWMTIVLASSYEGAYYLWQQAIRGRALEQFRVTNVDAVTRWFWNLPSLDGFQRAMWWTPQHEAALTLSLLLLVTMLRARQPNALGTALFEGLLLGGALALSSFNGVLLVAWYALAQTGMLALAFGRDLVPWLRARLVAAATVVVFLGLVIALGIVQLVEGSFIFGWNRYFLRGPWAFVLLNFGPALFFAPLGVALALRTSTRLVVTLATLVALSVTVFLFVELRGHENTQVSFRTGQLVWIALTVLLAFAIDAWRTWSRAFAFGLSAMLVLASAAAFPTVALDWYNAHDISNVRMSPGGFPWTVHVSSDELAAATWIQESLPETATIQTDALPRARHTWALVPAFLQRRMGVGNGIAQLNPGKVAPLLDTVHAAFGKLPAEEAHTVLRDLGVDYVYIGDVERTAHGASLLKFSQRPDLFTPVFAAPSVEILEVRR
jgi:hypothetical protein